MGIYNLWFFLLLPLTFCSCEKGYMEPLVKTIGKEADFTPVCTHSKQSPIIFVVCRIRPVSCRKKECHLTYRWPKDFGLGCDSRFSLVFINQTMFLQLNNLTPENSGNYTCWCSQPSGTSTLQLKITVADDGDTTRQSDSSLNTALLGILLLVFISITGVIQGVFHRNICQQKELEPLTWHELNSTVSYKVAEKFQPYHLRHEETELYSNVKMA